jgi:hypothetical protein
MLRTRALALHFVNQIDQPLNAATEPVQFPDDQGVRLSQVGKGFFESGAIGLGTAAFIGEDAFAPGLTTGATPALRAAPRSASPIES